MADVNDVLILLISTSLKVLFNTFSFKDDILNALCESFNLSNNITVSYSEYPRIVNNAMIVDGVISRPITT